MRNVGVLLAVLLLGSAVAADNPTHDADQFAQYSETVSRYFRAPAGQIDMVADHVNPSEIPVVFYIADRGKVSVEKVVELRGQGETWMEVAADCNLNAADFYIMVVGEIKSKTFAPIFAKYTATPMTNWKSLELTDDEIVNLVNLRLVASQNDYSAYDVMAMYDYYTDWQRVNRKTVLAKAELLRKQRMAQSE